MVEPEAEDEDASEEGDGPLLWVEPAVTTQDVVLSKPYHEMRGHTSYLTFASYHPLSVRQQGEFGPSSKTRLAAGKGERDMSAAAIGEAPGGDDDDDTEYGSDGLDEVVGTLTDEEMRALMV